MLKVIEDLWDLLVHKVLQETKVYRDLKDQSDHEDHLVLLETLGILVYLVSQDHQVNQDLSDLLV